MRRLLTIAFALLAVAAAIYFMFPDWVSTPSEPPYREVKLDRGAIVAAVNATGTINPTTTVIVSSQLSGQVVEILADYNSEVKADQVVARLNADQIRARLDAARADLTNMRATASVQESQINRVLANIEQAKAAELDAQAQIARNQALLAETDRTVQRQTELKSRGVTTEAAYQTAVAQRDAQKATLDSARANLASVKAQALGLQADLAVARSQLEAGKAQILQREAAVRQIEVDLRNSEIKSPVSGTVVQRNVELGQTVAASLQAPTLFLIADDLSHMEIAANIDETDVGRLKAGQTVAFTVNAYPARSFTGVVKQVRLGSQVVQNVVIYTTIVSVENRDKALLPGMTANLRIETDRRDDVLRVPNAALRWRPPAAAGEPVPAPAGAAQAQEGQRSGGGARALTELSDAIKAELSPSAEQQKEIDAAFMELRQTFAARRGQGDDQNARREMAQAARARLIERIAAVLTPDQRAKFETIRTRMAESRGNARTAMQSGRVYVLGAGNKPEAVVVRLGVTDGATTEVMSDRLQAGQSVIVGGGPKAPEPAAGGQPAQQRGPRFGF